MARRQGKGGGTSSWRSVVAAKGAAALMGGCLTMAGVCGCLGPARAEVPVSPSVEAGEDGRGALFQRAESLAVPRLVRLVDERYLETLDPERFSSASLKAINSLSTPEGYRLKYRFFELGVPVAQGLSLSEDRQLQARLVEVARFETRQRTRAESLLILAAQRNPDHFKFFKEAILDQDVAVKFAAVEALLAWNRPEALPLLLNAATQDWSPFIRVFAAQSAFRLGAPEGRELLRRYLTDTDWLVRAMSAYYLGDVGDSSDLDRVLGRISAERENDFVLAELCLAGLKLWGQKLPSPPPPPPPKTKVGSRPKVNPMFEIEPLVVRVPRLKVSGAQLVPPQIDVELIGLIEKIAKELPEEQTFDERQGALRFLVTPQGFGLYVRYTDINFLLTEGLAGTSNTTLVTRLESLARTAQNRGVRAAALVALGHDPSRVDFSLFDYALRDPDDVRVRFGAVEGLAAQKNPIVRGLIAGAAQSDSSLVVRLFAAQALARSGDAQGVDILRRYLNDPEWVVRALATYYLGRYGDDADFERLMVNLERETEDRVIAENCLAVLRMSK